MRAFVIPGLLVLHMPVDSWRKFLFVKNGWEIWSGIWRKISWPLDQMNDKQLHWMGYVYKKMTACTVESYLHCLGIIHTLKKCNESACSSKVSKLLIKENEFYKPYEKLERKIYDASIITANWPWNKEMQSVIKF